MSRFRYVQPTNEDGFEALCLVLLREARPRQRYAHPGEEHYGVDLFDMSGAPPLFAAQCKHHDPNESLQPAEIEAEVRKALNFPLTIGTFAFLTTAKKTGATQLKVRELNERHRRDGRFSIQLLTWDEMESLIDSSPAARALLGYESGRTVVEAVQCAVQPLHTSLAQLVADRSADLDDAKGRLDAGEPQAAPVFVEQPADAGVTSPPRRALVHVRSRPTPSYGLGTPKRRRVCSSRRAL